MNEWKTWKNFVEKRIYVILMYGRCEKFIVLSQNMEVAPVWQHNLEKGKPRDFLEAHKTRLLIRS